MSVSSVPIVRHRKVGVVEKLGQNAHRVVCDAQGRFMDAGAEVSDTLEHLKIDALAHRQDDPTRARLWRLVRLAVETAKREGAYETHSLLVDAWALAHRHEAAARTERTRRALMRLAVWRAHLGIHDGNELLETVLTGQAPTEN